MNLAPGGLGVVSFNVSLGSSASGVGAFTASIFRNGILTTIVPTISSDVTGHYTVSFPVPANWVEFDIVEARSELTYGTGPQVLRCTKTVGVVTLTPQNVQFLTDLSLADQVKVGNEIVYYLKGSGQTVELHRQNINGSTCVEDVSLTS